MHKQNYQTSGTIVSCTCPTLKKQNFGSTYKIHLDSTYKQNIYSNYLLYSKLFTLRRQLFQQLDIDISTSSLAAEGPPVIIFCALNTSNHKDWLRQVRDT